MPDEVLLAAAVKVYGKPVFHKFVNTAISQMMIFVNAVYKEINEGRNFPLEYAEGLIKLLNPVIPFITEEIWTTVLGRSALRLLRCSRSKVCVSCL